MRLRARSAVLSTAALSGLVASATLATDAQQWRVEDGGNGHWYAARSIAEGRTWDSARTEAEADGAHLATFSSAAEYSWCVAQLVDRADLWIDDSWGPFIGGRQEKGAQAPTLGWSWIDGSDWYADWGLANCGADDSCGDQRSLAFGRCVTAGVISFNDEYPAQPPAGSSCTGIAARSALFEWSADCNSDGIVDFGQIRAGELDDANANNIPDCCESGTPCDPCAADVDQSGTVNGVDLAAILSVWGTAGAKYPRADIDASGTVDAADLAALLNSWGACP